jgi:ABC-2 type transport system permease protein
MTWVLVRKSVKDLQVPLLVVALLLVGFECLWVKITQRVTGELLPMIMGLAAAQRFSAGQVEEVLFEGPGRMVRTLMGGESISLTRAMDVLSIGYVHPLVQTILCIWAVGRSAGAITGEIDRGTMELLLGQPVPRWRIILANLLVDAITIPVLCLSLWGGTWLGSWVVGPIGMEPTNGPLSQLKISLDPETVRIAPALLGPALWNVAALVFAVSGYTMWLSARGRFRSRVLGAAILITLLQFLVNVVGQMWDTIEPLRAFTVFYYYQPQQIALHDSWYVPLTPLGNGANLLGRVPVLAVPVAIGIFGYLLALWTLARRDLPAPL